MYLNSNVLKKHSRPVVKMCIDNNDYLYTASKDKTINVFDKNGTHKYTLSSHKGMVSDVDVNNQELILSCSTDGKVTVHKDKKVVFSQEQPGRILSANWSPKGDMFFTVTSYFRKSSLPCILHIYNAEYDCIYAKEFAFAAVIASWHSQKEILIGCMNGALHVLDIVNDKLVRSVSAHKCRIRDIQVSSDRKYVLTASEDKTAKLFDYDTLGLQNTYQSPTPVNSAKFHPHKSEVLIAGGQYARDVTTTCADSGHFEFMYFDMNSGLEIHKQKTHHFGPVHSLMYYPNGTDIVSCSEDGTIRIERNIQTYEERILCFTNMLTSLLKTANKNKRRRINKKLSKLSS